MNKVSHHTSIRFTKETKSQLDELKAHMGESTTKVILRAIDRMYQDLKDIKLTMRIGEKENEFEVHNDGSQKNATLINYKLNIIRSSSPGSSIKLNNHVLGNSISILNMSKNTISLYPMEGHSINGIKNNLLKIDENKSEFLWAVTDSGWVTCF